MAVTFEQIRALPGYDGMSDDDIIAHAKTIGVDPSDIKQEELSGISFDQIRAIPGYADMSDDQIIKRGKANGIDVSDLEVAMEKPSGAKPITDTVRAVGQGALQVPGMITGLADIPAGLAGYDRPFSRGADALGKATGITPNKWATDADKSYSPEMQEQVQNVNQAWDDPNTNAVDVAKAYVSNPLATYKNVVNSAPSMVVGGALGKAALAGGLIKSAAVGAGIGEGAVMAGQSMDSIDDSVSPRKAALAASGVGVLGGAIGAGSGKIASRLGLADVDQLIATGGTAGKSNAAMPLGKRIVAGAIQEGPIEEGLQSAAETGAQNYAENKPITEGMGRNVVEGSIAGAAMGAPSQLLSGNNQPAQLDNTIARPGDINTEDQLDLGDNNDQSKPAIGIPELIFTADGTSLNKRELINGFMANGASEQDALDYIKKITMTPVSQRTEVNLDPYRFLQERDSNRAQSLASQNEAIDPEAQGERQAIQNENATPDQPFDNSIPFNQQTQQQIADEWEFQDALNEPPKAATRNEIDQEARQRLLNRTEQSAVSDTNGGSDAQLVDAPTMPSGSITGAAEQPEVKQPAPAAYQPQQETTNENIEADKNAPLSVSSGIQEVNGRGVADDEVRQKVELNDKNFEPKKTDSTDSSVPIYESNVQADQPETQATLSNQGVPFKTKGSAQVALKSSGYPNINPETHEVVPVDGGFGHASIESNNDANNNPKIQDAVQGGHKYDSRGRELPRATNRETANGITGNKAENVESTMQDGISRGINESNQSQNNTAGEAAVSAQAEGGEVGVITGDKIDGKWTKFTNESGSIGIPRAEMPQVKAEHRGALVNFLNARDISHEQVDIPANELKPTQAEFSPSKVEKAKKYEGGDRSILISSDNHVVDGHHQWLAKLDGGENIKAIRLNAPIKTILDDVKAFPSTKFADGAIKQDQSTDSNAWASAQATETKASTDNSESQLNNKVDVKKETSNSVDDQNQENVSDKKQGIKFSKSSDDMDFAHEVLSELAEVDEIFRYPVSKYTTLPEVMKDVAPGFKYIGEENNLDQQEDFGADKKLLFRNEKGKRFDVYVRGNELWIDVSRFDTGERGSAVYAAVGNYAYNTGNVFIADPHSLSDDAAIRRTSAMLSLALRFGTTDFMEPGPKQLKGIPELGVKPLKWSGSDVDRTKSLIHTFLSNLQNQFPELKDIKYDFGKRQFVRSKDGLPVDWSKFAQYRKAGAVGVRARAGEATARRGAFIRSLISSESSERPGILEQVLNRSSSLVKNGNLSGMFSTSQSTIENPHTTQSLTQSIRSALDAKFGEGWLNRLLATEKFKVISRDDARGIVGNKVKYHKVWHGSPHDHDGFDSSKIGTGEGAQAYGYGHYFTDEKEIAEYYKRNLSRNYLSIDGKAYSPEIGSDSPEDLATSMVMSNNGIEEAKQWFKDNIESRVVNNELKDLFSGALDWLNKNEHRVSLNNGKLYEVELAPTQDEYLDWDKPLSEQSKLVKNALDLLKSESDGIYDLYNESLQSFENSNGEAIYRALANDSGSAISASRDLHRFGIRGIRYKAEGGKSDANNYVIFDDNDIKIEAKYSKNGDILAFYNPADDTSYFVHDNISKDTSAKALYGLVSHEVAVHQLQLLRSDKEFQDLLKRVEKMSKFGKMKQAAERVPEDTKPEHVAEEMLAYFVEQNPQHSITQKLIQLVRKALRMIGRALPVLERTKWIRWSNTHSEADIISMATSALRQAPDALMFDNIGREKESTRNSFAGKKITNNTPSINVDPERNAANDWIDSDMESWSGSAYDYENGGNNTGMTNEKLESLVAQYAGVDGKPSREDLKDAVGQYRMIEALYFNKDGSPKKGAMLAPNGKPTKLNKVQWIQTRTENFKRWFGNSKIVDENGDPLVVYHGTGNDVEMFSIRNSGDIKGFYAAPYLEGAVNFATMRSGNPNIMLLYAAIKNAATYNDFVNARRELTAKYGEDWEPEQVTQLLKAKGFDGYFDENETIAFESQQYKSATGNTGTFNPNSNDIRFSKSPDSSIVAEAKRKAGLGPKKTLTQAIISILNRGLNANKQAVKEWWSELQPRLEQGVFDKFYGIKLAEKEILGDVAHSLSGYISARLSTGSSSTMQALLLHGAPKWADGIIQRKDNSKGFAEILQPVKDDLENFTAWMVGRRADRLFKEGKENNFSRDEIDALLGLKKDGYQAVADDIANMNSAVLDLAEDAGLVNPESRKLFESNDYIPFYRLIEGKKSGPGKKGGLTHQTSGIKMLKGGDNPMSDPLGNMMQNWAHLIDASMKNDALNKTLTNLDRSRFVESIPSIEFKQALVPKSQIKKLMKESGLPNEVVDLMPEELTNGIAKMWSMQAPIDPDVVRVMRGGKPEYYRVNDAMLLTSLTAVNQIPFGGIFKPMRYMKQLLTGAVTADPTFMARNFIRDSMHSWTIAEEKGFKLGVDSFHGAIKSFKEEGGYIDMMFAGASFQGGYGNYNNPDAARTSMDAALRKRGIKDIQGFKDSILDAPKKYWEMYRSVGDAIENANREAILENAKRSGAEKAKYLFEAKDLMDFSMQGSFTLIRAMSDMLPFFNARLIGLYRLAKAGKTQEARRMILAKGLSIAMFSLALLALNADNDDYEELEDWDKDQYWHFFFGDQHYRIPKPFELGLLFGTVPERSARALLGKDTLGKYAERMVHGASDTLAFNPVPQLFKPFIELYANKDMFTGRAIEGMSDEGKLPSARYNEYTSETMRALSSVLPEALGASPKRLEHLMHGYMGALGMYALGASDMLVRELSGMPELPASRMDKLPIIKAFYQEKPAMHTKYSTEFYDMLNEVNQVHKTINAYKKEGRITEANELRSDNADKLRKRHQLEISRKKLSKLKAQVDIVYRSKLGADEKRRRIDALMQRSNEVARLAVERSHPYFN